MRPVGKLSSFDHVEGLSPIVPVGEMSSVDPARGPPGGLVPVVWTDFPDRKDPVITQLPAEVPVGDNRDVVNMDVTVDICQLVPDVINSHAVVAMVGLDAMRMGVETRGSGGRSSCNWRPPSLPTILVTCTGMFPRGPVCYKINTLS